MDYDSEILEQINDNADLIGYVENIYDLEERNGLLWAHCPLHVDNTASLCFYPNNNSFYCFSCGRGGRMISYLMHYEHLPFEDAVDKAARLAQIDMSKMCQSKAVIFLRNAKKMLTKRERMKYQHEILPQKAYCKYKKEKIQAWQDEGITQEVMDLFGVRMDETSNRIVYPVYDISGNLINIKGRTLYKDYKALNLQKYINYYPVGVMDYFQGLNITLDSVQKSGEIIIFESVKSVMKAYGWGYKNCASAEKHTLTDEQIELLIRLRVNVVLAYDSDISYSSPDVKANVDRLKRMTNVFLIEDYCGLLGGKEAKNAPVDCGEEIWETLYENKRKVY